MRGRARGRASVSRLLGIVTYALTRRHCLSHSLHSPHPPSAARRKAAAGEEVSQPRPVCRSAGRSVDGSWPFICIANYEKEKDSADGRGGNERRCARSTRTATSAFVARCQLHNCARHGFTDMVKYVDGIESQVIEGQIAFSWVQSAF